MLIVGPYTLREEALRYQAKFKDKFSFLNPIVVKSKNDDNSIIKKNIVK